MEIYRNAASTRIYLELPAGVIASVLEVDIVVYEGGKDIYTFNQVMVDGTRFYVELPWHLTRNDRDLYVNWTITYDPGTGPISVAENQYVQVVTPILPLAEIANIAGITLATNRDDVIDLERRVRYAVQSYSGQNFGMFYGIMTARGSGGNKLVLPAPLLQFAGLSFDGIYRPNYGITVENDGWLLVGGKIEINSIKQAPPEWMLDRFDYVGKIYAPQVYGNHYFAEGTEYKVEGMWGYNDVPGDVRQAARLLVQDYSCDESLWRERYITNVQAADWRFQFSTLAFAGTGNVQADQILGGYRRQTMAVV